MGIMGSNLCLKFLGVQCLGEFTFICNAKVNEFGVLYFM